MKADDALPPGPLLARVADMLDWPLLLLRRDATLVHANAAGRRWLQGATVLGATTQGGVRPVVAAQRRSWQALLETADSDAQLVSWPLGAGVCRAWLRALQPAGEDTLLLAVQHQGSRQADVQAFGRVHGLTGVETRLLERLDQGDTIGRAAAALGIAPATARSHAQALRRKTGCTSITAVLSVLARLPPLAGVGA